MKYIIILIALIGLGAGGFYFQDEITDAISSLSGQDENPIIRERFVKEEFSLSGYSRYGEGSWTEDMRIEDLPSNLSTEDEKGYLEVFRRYSFSPSNNAVEHAYRRFITNYSFSGGSFGVLNDTVGRDFLDVDPIHKQYYEGSLTGEESFFLDEISISGVRVLQIETNQGDTKFIQYENYDIEERTYRLDFNFDFERFVGTFQRIGSRTRSGVSYLSPSDSDNITINHSTNENFLLNEREEEYLEGYRLTIGNDEIEDFFIDEPTYTLEEIFKIEVEPTFVNVSVVLGHFRNPFGPNPYRYELGDNDGNISKNIVSFYVRFGDIVREYDANTPTNSNQVPLTTSMIASGIFGNSFKDLTGYSTINSIGTINPLSGSDLALHHDYSEKIAATLLNQRDRNYMVYFFQSQTMGIQPTNQTVSQYLNSYISSGDGSNLGYSSINFVSGTSVSFKNMGGEAQHPDLLNASGFSDVVSTSSSSANAMVFRVEPTTLSNQGHEFPDQVITIDDTPDGFSEITSNFGSRYFPNFNGTLIQNNNTGHIYQNAMFNSFDRWYPEGASGSLPSVFRVSYSGEEARLLTGEENIETQELLRNVTLSERTPKFEELEGFALTNVEVIEESDDESMTFTVQYISGENEIIPKNVLGLNLNSPFTENENPFQNTNGYEALVLINTETKGSVYKVFEINVLKTLEPSSSDSDYIVFTAQEEGRALHGDRYIDGNGNIYKLHRNRSGVEHEARIYLEDGRSRLVDPETGATKIRVTIEEFIWDEYETQKEIFFDTSSFPSGYTLTPNPSFSEGDREKTFYYSEPLE